MASNSSMYVALCKGISLQRGQFCTRSLASRIPRFSADRSSWIIKDKSNVFLYLLPAKRDVQLTTWLRCARQYPTIYARSNRYKNSLILFGLNHFQWSDFVYAWFSCMFLAEQFIKISKEIFRMSARLYLHRTAEIHRAVLILYISIHRTKQFNDITMFRFSTQNFYTTTSRYISLVPQFVKKKLHCSNFLIIKMS